MKLAITSKFSVSQAFKALPAAKLICVILITKHRIHK